MARKLMYAEANGLIGIEEIQLDESWDSPVSSCTVTCERVSGLELGETVIIKGGTQDLNGVLFCGVIDSIDLSYPPNVARVKVASMLTRAQDAWVIPWPTPASYTNRTGGYNAASVVVSDMLNGSLLGSPYTSYSYDPTTFVFAVLAQNEIAKTVGLEISHKSRLQAIQEIADMLNYRVWADYAGRIFFKKRPPFPSSDAGDPAHPNSAFLNFSKASQNIVKASYTRTAKGLRNEVFIEGYGHAKWDVQSNPPVVNATGKYPLPVAGQPYISFDVNGGTWGAARNYGGSFKQGAEIISSWLVSTQDINSSEQIVNPSDDNPIVVAANSNLTRANKITEFLSLSVPGDYRLHAITCNDGSGTPGGAVNAIVSVTDDFSGGNMSIIDSTNGNWFIRALSTNWSRNTFTTDLTLCR